MLWLSGTLNRLFERLTKFGGFGLSFEFTEKSARETRESVEQSLGTIRSAIQRKLTADVRAAGLQEAFGNVVQSSDLKDKKGYRCTIHIPDPLYLNQLYQLLDYYPKGGGSGRTFSSRAGIIGMAWRNLESDKWHQHTQITERDLIRQWGMTVGEAENRESTDRKKLFLAVPLLDVSDAVPIGVFYFDAENRQDLGLSDPLAPDESTATQPRPQQTQQAARDADEFLNRIEAQIKSEFRKKMAEPLAKLVEAAKREGPQLALEGQ